MNSYAAELPAHLSKLCHFPMIFAQRQKEITDRKSSHTAESTASAAIRLLHLYTVSSICTDIRIVLTREICLVCVNKTRNSHFQRRFLQNIRLLQFTDIYRVFIDLSIESVRQFTRCFEPIWITSNHTLSDIKLTRWVFRKGIYNSPWKDSHEPSTHVPISLSRRCFSSIIKDHLRTRTCSNCRKKRRS